MGNICNTMQFNANSQILHNKKSPNFLIREPFNFTQYQIQNSKKINYEHLSNIFIDQQDLRYFGNYLSSLNDNQFIDKQFEINGGKVRLLKCQNSKDTNFQMFGNHNYKNIIQLNQQFCYLSSIFCFIAQKKTLCKNIFSTNINQIGFYIVNLHPNGQNQRIIIDDKLPYQQDLQYSSTKNFQPWPYLLQKAWVKLIGSYQKAKGLSPQDAYQQILGLPAYSYFLNQIDANSIEKQLRKQLEYQSCIILTAKRQQQFIQESLFERQVFYLVGLKEIKNIQYFHLRCSYQNFNFQQSSYEPNSKKSQQVINYMSNNPGQILITINQLFNYFQFCTLGLYRPQYILSNFQIFLDPFPDMYYTFEVAQKISINIRIIQYYEGYLKNNKNYEYSPVYIKLYNKNSGNLIAQGCKRCIGGVKSSNVFEQIFGELTAGEYLLKIQIDWIFPQKINFVQLVAYCNEPINFKKFQRNQGKEKQECFNKKQLSVMAQKNEMYGIKYGSKWLKYGLLILIQNCKNVDLKIRIIFKNSRNLIPIRRMWKNKTIQIQIQKMGALLIQMRKQDPHINSYLGNYQFQILNQTH